MIVQERDDGKTPFDLLAELEPMQRWEFLGEFPALHSYSSMVHSETSEMLGGSALWSCHLPVFLRQQLQLACRAHEGLSFPFRLLAVLQRPAAQEGSSWTPSWGIAALLPLGDGGPFAQQRGGSRGVCTCLIEESLVGGRMDGATDEEIFEPAIKVQVGSQSKVYKGRVAAQRGIWIGGTGHFDDLVVDGLPGAAALLVYDPPSATWMLHPSSAQISARLPSNASGGVSPPTTRLPSNASGGVSSPTARLPSSSGDVSSPTEATAKVGAPRRFQISPQASDSTWRPVEGRLAPSFTTRRMLASAREDLVAFSALRAIGLQEAQRLRERLVLVQLRAEIRRSPGDAFPACQVDQFGAVVSDFIIGRQEGCSLELNECAVSRSHCIVQLRNTAPENGQEHWELVAFDDGSLGGTLWMRPGEASQAVGVGPGEAVEVKEGHVLVLGHLVTVRLRKVSPVLRLDDHVGLAAFFDRTGETSVSQTLLSERPRRRQTEILLSSTMSQSRRMSMPAATIG